MVALVRPVLVSLPSRPLDHARLGSFPLFRHKERIVLQLWGEQGRPVHVRLHAEPHLPPTTLVTFHGLGTTSALRGAAVHRTHHAGGTERSWVPPRGTEGLRVPPGGTTVGLRGTPPTSLQGHAGLRCGHAGQSVEIDDGGLGVVCCHRRRNGDVGGFLWGGGGRATAGGGHKGGCFGCGRGKGAEWREGGHQIG